MNRRLHYTTTARKNLRDLSDFLSDETGSEDVAESFVLALDERCRRLASLPGTLGTPCSDLRPELRSTPHRGYLILFRYRPDTVEIVNILHGSRDVIGYYGDPE